MPLWQGRYETHLSDGPWHWPEGRGRSISYHSLIPFAMTLLNMKLSPFKDDLVFACNIFEMIFPSIADFSTSKKKFRSKDLVLFFIIGVGKLQLPSPVWPAPYFCTDWFLYFQYLGEIRRTFHDIRKLYRIQISASINNVLLEHSHAQGMVCEAKSIYYLALYGNYLLTPAL